jgi:UPF0755 protein
MLFQRLWPTVRNILIPMTLAVGLLACVMSAFLLIRVRSESAHLNPVEALALRVMLANQDKALATAGGTDPKPVRFVVGKGDSASTIAANLLGQGFIKDADLFRNYARYYGVDAKFQAGTYFLKKTYTIPEIAKLLTNAGASTVTVQVIEGWRIEQIADAVDANPSLLFRGPDFKRLVGQGAPVSDEFRQRVGLPVGQSLEGFLFPSTYLLPADAPADELVTRMLQQFNTQVTDQMSADARARGLSIWQIVTLASIVEREAVVDDERPRIAGVYLNRLLKGMNLDADPTIQYALGNTRQLGNWWPNITQTDYQGVKSPFNTYLSSGLPPGPIANPGIASIRAVIYPESTPYLYFRASCDNDGRHRFAQTLAEQYANACP